jgi:hypothetical protein
MVAGAAKYGCRRAKEVSPAPKVASAGSKSPRAETGNPFTEV